MTKPSIDDGFGSYNGFHNNGNEKMAIPPSYSTMEDSLSKGLLNLSMNDRNAVEEEIHGVRCLGVTEETPDLLQRSLQEFNRELLAIKNSPSRRTSLRNTKNNYDYLKQSSKNRSNNSQDAPIDVLRNVIDTTQNSTSASSSSSSSTVTGTPAAKQQCYLNDPDVRLRFLRCESFDARAAAKRFVNFFDLAREVFGDSVADRPIRLSDFLETTKEGGRLRRYQQHEKKTLSNSRIQYMPFRDRSGRRVKVGVGGCNSELDLILRIKINLLLDWIASEDVETQQKGVVIVVWPSNPPSTNTPNNTANGAASSSSGVSSSSEGEDDNKWEGFLRPRLTQNVVSNHKRYYQAQPIRVAAIHWCSQDKPIYRVLNSLFYFSLDSKSQPRYKVHFGESLEIRYSLQAFGIPVDLMPLTHTMALKRQNHSHWMACRKHIEGQQQHQHQQQQQQQQHHYQQHHYQPQHQFQRQQHYVQEFAQPPWDDEQALRLFESYAPSSPVASQGSFTPSDPLVLVECPRSYDVIIGKAKVCTNNPGNGFYSSLIEAAHDDHDALVHAKDKVAMTWKILYYITEQRKGRFLDWNKSLNAWVVIQDKVVIRKKIANSFKEYKRSRYVTTRSTNGSHKKKQATISAGDKNNDESATAAAAHESSSEHRNGTIGSNTNHYASKRQKISGCLGDITACDGKSTKGISSMFAGL